MARLTLAPAKKTSGELTLEHAEESEASPTLRGNVALDNLRGNSFVLKEETRENFLDFSDHLLMGFGPGSNDGHQLGSTKGNPWG